jgi:hypothetical protein
VVVSVHHTHALPSLDFLDDPDFLKSKHGRR